MICLSRNDRSVAKCEMNRYTIVFVCCIALLLAAAAAFVFALRNYRQVRQPPEVPPSLISAEVRVKAIGQKNMVPVRPDAADASASIAVICGHDAATADSTTPHPLRLAAEHSLGELRARRSGR